MAFSSVSWHTLPMAAKPFAAILAIVAFFISVGSRQSPVTSHDPSYTADGQLRLPENYRTWIYLSSGFDMSYNPAMTMDQHMFDNVFANPEAYQAFLKTGTWPDRTMLVLEARRAESTGSINKAGQFQGTSVMGVEVHIKDESRFPGKWAFFAFGNSKTAKMIPTSADCYSCHEQHGAVDTTFVQFYPALLPVAAAKSTLSPSYLRDTAPAAGSKDPQK
jgi:hypothetical protein